MLGVGAEEEDEKEEAEIMGFGWVGGQEGSHNSEEKAVEGVEKLAEGSQLVFR